MELESLSQFSALSHPNRLALFRLLMRRYPDHVSAGEIVAALGLKPSTTSVYLGTLHDSGLITQTRLGTSLRYRANIETASSLITYLFEDCCRGRPALCAPLADHPKDVTPQGAPMNVLFVCTANSARSIFAETILRGLAGGRFNAYSAGTHPATAPNPLALDMLKAKGHDVAALHSKHISTFQTPDAPHMDYVFTVCDQAANEECPTWDGQPINGHWGLPDPAQAQGSLAERRLAFQQTYGALHNRLQAFVALPLTTQNRNTRQANVDEIAARNFEGSHT